MSSATRAMAPADQPSAGALRTTLVVVSLILAAETGLYGAIAPLLPTFSDEFGLSKGEAGVLVAGYALGMSVFAIPMGFAAGRDGGRRTLLGGLLLMAAACACFGLSETAVLLTASRVAQGIAGAAVWAGGLMWLTTITPVEKRGAAIGIAFGAGLAGQVAGPALGAIAALTSRSLVFCAFGAAAACAILPFLRLPRPAAAAAARAAAAAAVERPERSAGRRRAAVAFTLGLLVPSMVVGALEVLMPLQLDDLGASDVLIGAIFVGMSAATAVASPFAGRWSDRAGPLWPMATGLGIAVPLAPLLLLPGSIGLYTFVGSVLWLAVVISWTPAIAQLTDLAERSGAYPGVVWGLSNLLLAGGILLGSAGGGGLAGAAGDAATLWAASALVALTLVMLAATRPGAAPR